MFAKYGWMLCCCAAAAIASGGEAEIGIDDFLRDFYHTSTGRAEVVGSAIGGTMADGQKALALRYDFSGCPDANNSFLRFHMDRVMPAKPLKVRLELCNRSDEAIPLSVFFADAGNEVYIGRGSAPKGNGISRIEIPIHPYPAWESGDRNGKVDYPLTFNAILIDMPPQVRKGELLISKVSVVTGVDAESCMTMKLNADSAFYGRTRVPFRASLRALDPSVPGTVRFRVELTDLFTGASRTAIDRRVAANADAAIETELALPFGSYSGKAQLFSASGKLMESKDFALQSLSADCSVYPNGAFREYVYRYGINGGVHGFLLPETAQKLGMSWIRFEWPNWSQLESAPGVYRTQQMATEIAPWVKHNVRPVLLQCLYHNPAFANPKNLPAFSRSYGQYLRAIFADPANPAQDCELGNEDNGHNKFLYTEVARNGAAAVRSERPFAVLSNTGTAFVDVNFLRFQHGRGLLAYLDALCVHPYTNNAAAGQQVSPERFRTLGYLENLEELAFETGGMKELWATEFGWPNGDFKQERDRTMLYVRQMLVCDAAELAINGLYTWDRDYGIVRRSAGAAMNRFCAVRNGSRFGGQKIADGIYANLYLAPGRRTLAVWSPDDGVKPMPYRARRYTDQFGNPVAAPTVSQSVTYLEDPDEAAVNAVAVAGCEYARKRFLTFFAKANRPAAFAVFAGLDAADAAGLGKALSTWAENCRSAIAPQEQALVDFAWRWYRMADRAFGRGEAAAGFDAAHWRGMVETSNRTGIDRMPLRYLLRQAERLVLEEQMASGDAAFAAGCRRELAVLGKLLAAFGQYGREFPFAVFTALYMEHDGALGEKLRFIPGRSSTVRARVSNYGKRAAAVRVRPQLPEGWRCEPAERRMTVAANGEAWVDFSIHCSPNTVGAEAIRVETLIGDRPKTTLFDDVELIPAISGSVTLVHDLLTDAPLRLTVANREAKMVSGQVKLLAGKVGGGALAVAPIRIPAGGSQELTLRLTPGAVRRLMRANAVFDLEFLLDDGRGFRQNSLDVDFAAATRPVRAVKADGDLAEWAGALPLKLNRAAYTGGSYGSGWTPEDCSATAYLMYDEENLYFVAVVRDQTFHQQQLDDAMWQHDSIQLVLAADGDAREYVGLTLGLSPAGALIWHENARRRIQEAAFAVKLGHEFVYEAAIPWRSLGGGLEAAVKRGSFRYAIAVNDDDAIVPRRYLERFEGTIVHAKEIAKFARIPLLKKSAQPVKMEAKTVFEEDFAGYPAGTVPAGYRVVRGGDMPPDAIAVRRGEKGNMLHLENPAGYTPNRYTVMTGAVALQPGKRYRLTARVRGSHAGASILGVCSDSHGNKDYQYLKLPERMPDWTVAELEFTGPQTGRCNLVFRNDGKIGGVDVADVRITEL